MSFHTLQVILFVVYLTQTCKRAGREQSLCKTAKRNSITSCNVIYIRGQKCLEIHTLSVVRQPLVGALSFGEGFFFSQNVHRSSPYMYMSSFRSDGGAAEWSSSMQ